MTFGMPSPLEQNAINYMTGHTPTLGEGMGPAGYGSPYAPMVYEASYPAPENPYLGSTFNAYGEMISPYDVKVGWADSQDMIHDAAWGNTTGWIDAYDVIHDHVGNTLGAINPYGQVVSPYSSF